MAEAFSYSTLFISGIATLFSVFSFIVSHNALKVGVEPILVFVSVQLNGKKAWMIENVGRGPALDLKVYLGHSEDTWDDGRIVHPIPAGTRMECPFKEGCIKLGASYKSLVNKQYHSTCYAHDRIYKKGSGPKEWKRMKIEIESNLLPRYAITENLRVSDD